MTRSEAVALLRDSVWWRDLYEEALAAAEAPLVASSLLVGELLELARRAHAADLADQSKCDELATSLEGIAARIRRRAPRVPS